MSFCTPVPFFSFSKSPSSLSKGSKKPLSTYFFILGIILLILNISLITKINALTVRETLLSDPRLSETARFVQKSGALNDFNSSNYGGQITIAVPSNSAWKRESQARISFLQKPANKNDLDSLILLSVLDRPYHRKNAVNGETSITTLLGVDATIDPQKNELCLLDPTGNRSYACAKVDKWDIECSDGVIHIVDSVLYPIEFYNNPSFPK